MAVQRYKNFYRHFSVEICARYMYIVIKSVVNLINTQSRSLPVFPAVNI